MASNQQVAHAFVNNHPRTLRGSNTLYVPTSTPDAARTFTSYATIMAMIHRPPLGPNANRDVLYYRTFNSQSTIKQMNYVHRAWRDAHLMEDFFTNSLRHTPVPRVFCVAEPINGPSDVNIRTILRTAQEALTSMMEPRIRMTTKLGHYGTFLSSLQAAHDLNVQHPIAGFSAYRSTETMRLFDLLDAVRGPDPAHEALAALTPNPVGLAETILRVKAMMALEG